MATTLEDAPTAPPAQPRPVRAPRQRSRLYRFFTRNRRPIVVIHRWLSFVLLAFIVLESATGAALVFAPEIDRWVNSSAFAATAGDRGTDAAVAAAQRARTGEPVDSVVPPGDGRAVYTIYTVDTDGEFHQVLVDPGTARVLAKDHHEPAFMELLERLHFNLNSTSIFGFAPLTIMAWLSLGWLFILVTGCYVWYWPRVKRWLHALRVRTRRGWFTFNLDLHNAIGLVVLIPLTLVIITGINFAFPQQTANVWNAVTFGTLRAPATDVATSKPAATEPIGAERAAAIVGDLDPAVSVDSVSLPGGSPIGVYAVFVTVDGSALDMVGGADEVEFDVDQYTGVIVKIRDPLDQNGATRVYEEWAAPVHFGTFGGTVTRWLWVGVGIAPIVLGVTGVVMYVIRFRRKRRGQPIDTDADPELDPELIQETV